MYRKLISDFAVSGLDFMKLLGDNTSQQDFWLGFSKILSLAPPKSELKAIIETVLNQISFSWQMEGFTKALILSSENRVDLQRRFEIIGQSVKLPWQAESAFKVLSNVNITSTHVASAIKGFTDGLSNPTEKNHISQAVLFEAALIGALGVYSN